MVCRLASPCGRGIRTQAVVYVKCRHLKSYPQMSRMVESFLVKQFHRLIQTAENSEHYASDGKRFRKLFCVLRNGT